MAMVGNISTTLNPLMQTWYDRRFLKRVSELIVMRQLGQTRPLPAGEGKTVYFSRWLNLPVTTTALTEGVNPSAIKLSAENVSAVIAQHGRVVRVSNLTSLVALDRNLSEKMAILATSCGETIESLIRNQVAVNATDQLVSTASAVSTILATDVIKSVDIRKAVRDLKDAKAIPYAGGYFAGVLDPFLEYDFQSDSTWVNAKQYSDVTDLYTGEIGRWFGTRFVCTTLPFRAAVGTPDTYAAAGAVHSALIMGQESFGCTELDGLKKQFIVKTSGPQDTSNPLNMYSTAGWKQSFVAKTLKSAWCRRILAGASA